MATRPIIQTPCVADRHATGAERIAEFATSKGNGGLFSVREMADGSAQVSLYRLDPSTIVFCPIENHRPSIGPKTLAQAEAARAMLAALELYAEARAKGWVLGTVDEMTAKAIAQAKAAGIGS